MFLVYRKGLSGPRVHILVRVVTLKSAWRVHVGVVAPASSLGEIAGNLRELVSRNSKSLEASTKGISPTQAPAVEVLL